MLKNRFEKERLGPEELGELRELSNCCKGDILKMTTLAGCGHPGGSISSLDMYLVLYRFASVDPASPDHPDRDRVIISHGHTSPGAYSVLARLGFFSVDEAVSGFRLSGSPFEGHVVRTLPGLEWSSGNLGQGLSAGCGFALAARLQGRGYHTFVAMSDGEQAKGQVAEARRFAAKYGLGNLTVVIDYNHIQISGRLEDVMPQNIADNYRADGWQVLEVDGHDHQALYGACRTALGSGAPTVILAETVMSRGISFMEGKPQYHGKALKRDECARALEELGLEDDLNRLSGLREKKKYSVPDRASGYPVVIKTAEPPTYGREDKIDNRSAFGHALKSVAETSCGVAGNTPLAVLDCDLASSVRTEDFARLSPCSFFQIGVQEHNAITLGGALSAAGVVTVFAGFGVFGIDETYNQSRLNDINDTNLKLVCTHCGLDVGEDGKTHQCIDYVGAFANFFNLRIVVPADPNQTDRVTRAVLGNYGNYLVAMGRSNVPVITDEQGAPIFGNDYQFEYGRADWLRRGRDLAVVTMGAPMAAYAVRVSDNLKKEGVGVAVLSIPTPLEIDGEALAEAAATGRIITFEDHHVRTGLGAQVASLTAGKGMGVRLRRIGVTDLGSSGMPEDLYRAEGLDVPGLTAAVREMLDG